MAFEPEELPPLVTHMTIAIFWKLHGSERHKFLGAFEVARAQLVRWGYLTSSSFPGPVEKIKLTAKGRKKDRPHKSEGAIKTVVFAALYRRWFKPEKDVKKIEEIAGRKGGPPKGLDPTRVEKVKKQRRKDEAKKKSPLRKKQKERGTISKKAGTGKVQKAKVGALKKKRGSLAAKTPKPKAGKKRMRARVPKATKAQKTAKTKKIKRAKKVARKRGR